MADQLEFEKHFEEYIALEIGSVSLKKFVDFDFECIKKFSTDVTNLKRIWNHRISKFIEKKGIQNVVEEELDWQKLSEMASFFKYFNQKENVQDSLNSSEKHIIKRKRSLSNSVISNTSSSPSSSTNTTKRRKIYVEYLNNGNSPEVNLVAETRKWEIGDVEVTKEFLEYRTQSIRKAKAGELMSIHEEFSLNCIILVDGMNSLSDSDLEYGFEPATWELMEKECRDRYTVDCLPAETESAIIAFAKAARQDSFEVDSSIKSFPVRDDNNLIEESLRNLIPRYAPNTPNKITKLKSSFTMEVVNPVLLPFLEENGMLSRRGTDGKVPDAAKNKEKGILFSDLSVFFEYGGDLPQEGLIMVEIEPPVKVNNGERPDYVKLGNELKSCIDKMIKDSLDDEDIVVTGVLIEGFMCTVFVMDLVYQATYRMIPISIFYLPRSRHDFNVLPQAYESLLKLRHITLSSAQKCFAFYRKKERKVIRDKYIVESIITPKSPASSESSSSKSASSS